MIGNQVWEETIKLTQDQEDWAFNSFNIFNDEDPGDRLSITSPEELPSWISINEQGIFSGVPQNTDVGYTLTWRAMDEEGESAYFRLRLEIANINKGPEYTEAINNIEVNEDDYKKISLNDLFTDEDKIHGDFLSYDLMFFDSENMEIEKPNWAKINYVTSVIPEIDNKFVLLPVIHRIDDNGSTGKELTAEELDELEKDTAIEIKIKANDLRDLELKGIVGVDLDISWNNNLELMPNSFKIQESLPLFNKVSETKGESVSLLVPLQMH